MDPGSIIALTVTAAEKLFSAIRIISQYRNADASSVRLVARLESLKGIIAELRHWAEDGAVRSRTLETSLHSALRNFEDVISDIEAQIRRFAPDGLPARLGPMQRVRYLWDESTIRGYEGILENQVQTLTLLTGIMQLREASDQDAELRSLGSTQVFSRSSSDARRLREGNSSGEATTVTTDQGTNMSAELAQDAILVNTHVYRQQLMAWQRRTQTSSASDLSPSQASSAGKLTIWKTLSSLTLGGESREQQRFKQLCKACQTNNPSWAEALILDKKVDVDGVDENNCSPLCHAINAGHLEIVKLLVQLKAKINGSDGKSSVALFTAVCRNKPDIVKYLLENRAVVDSPCRYKDGSFKTSLALAIEFGRVEIVRYLVQHNAKLDKVTRTGMSPLCLAVNNGHIEIVKLLLESHLVHVDEASSQAAWGSGLAALHVAAYRGFGDILDVILSANADIFQTCKVGNVSHVTANHLARRSCAKKLLAKDKGGVYGEDSRQRYPLFNAVEARDLEAVRANLECNAPVLACDIDNVTVFDLVRKGFVRNAKDLDTGVGEWIPIVAALLNTLEPPQRREEAGRMKRHVQDSLKSRVKPFGDLSSVSVLELMERLAELIGAEASRNPVPPSGVRGWVGQNRLASLYVECGQPYAVASTRRRTQGERTG